MPKSKQPLIDKQIAVSFNLSDVVVADYVQSAIERQVEAAIEHQVADAVREAVTGIVDGIGRERISKAVDQVLAEGWQKTNDYGERVGASITLKDRIGEILRAHDRYSGRGSYIDERVKERVDNALNKDLKADIEAARNKFKTEVDAVLTATIREALAKNLGLKT